MLITSEICQDDPGPPGLSVGKRMYQVEAGEGGCWNCTGAWEHAATCLEQCQPWAAVREVCCLLLSFTTKSWS